MLSKPLWILAVALTASTTLTTACPSNRRRLTESLVDGPWAPDAAAKERILQQFYRKRNLVIGNTCRYFLKSTGGLSFESDPGGFRCFTGGESLDGDRIATISGNSKKQTVTFTDSSCRVEAAMYKSSTNCWNGNIQGSTVVFDTAVDPAGKDISHVQLKVVCDCLCPDGGCGGDPHIKRWNGERYYYHGQGDLVLLRSPQFDDDAGLDVHIRTTIKDWYSKIDTTAVRIGDSILELSVGNTGTFLLNGKEYTHDDLPLSLHHEEYTFDRIATHENGKGTTYMLDLNNGDYITFRVMKFIMSLDISAGTEQDFQGSSGMMGSYPDGTMLARDGQTILAAAGQERTKKGDLDDINDAMGFEWQVRSSSNQEGEDPMLFSTTRDPQWPEPCVMPTVTQATSRHLRATNGADMERAQKACAGKNDKDFNFCVMDVIALGDESAAVAW